MDGGVEDDDGKPSQGAPFNKEISKKQSPKNED